MSGKPSAGKEKKKVYSRYRLLLLSGAFLVILFNPFLNYYFNQNFVQGWYQSLGVGDLWFVSPLEGLESFLVTRTLYLPSLVGMVPPVLLALFLGRVFCSWLCPVTFLLELVEKCRKKIALKPFLGNRLLVAKRVLWFVLIVELLLSMILGAPVFVFLSPPGLVGRELMMLVFFGKIALEGLLLVLIVFLELLSRRFFCRSFCPLGGFLAFVGIFRRLRVVLQEQVCDHCGLCRRTCPMGLVVEQGEGLGPYCWNCGECIEVCPTDALRFVWKGSGCLE